jgi:hypothetical protein
MTTPEDIQAFDNRQKEMFQEAAESGENIEEATHRIKNETREEWIRLIRNYPNV